MQRRVALLEYTDGLEVRTVSIIIVLMTEAVRTSEMSVYSN
jgi:hypothetical protein